MGFPPGPPLGKRVSPCVTEAFSLRSRPAQSSILRDTGGSVDTAHGRLRFDKHRIHIELIVCAENPRLCFANPHRLRPPAGVLARSLQTLRVCLTLAPCIEFDSPRYGGSVDGARPGQDARSASHLYWAGALRGESAYLLRKYAPASAACRRPRPRAKNAYAFSLRPRPA